MALEFSHRQYREGVQLALPVCFQAAGLFQVLTSPGDMARIPAVVSGLQVYKQKLKAPLLGEAALCNDDESDAEFVCVWLQVLNTQTHTHTHTHPRARGTRLCTVHGRA